MKLSLLAHFAFCAVVLVSDVWAAPCQPTQSYSTGLNKRGLSGNEKGTVSMVSSSSANVDAVDNDIGSSHDLQRRSPDPQKQKKPKKVTIVSFPLISILYLIIIISPRSPRQRLAEVLWTKQLSSKRGKSLRSQRSQRIDRTVSGYLILSAHANL